MPYDAMPYDEAMPCDATPFDAIGGGRLLTIKKAVPGLVGLHNGDDSGSVVRHHLLLHVQAVNPFKEEGGSSGEGQAFR